MKLLRFFLIITLIIFCCAGSLHAQTATAPALGDGSSGNPYQIATLENLYWIAASNAVVSSPDQATRWASNYAQTADINASATSGWNSGAGWKPIGYEDASYTGIVFSGTYNGQGHSITGLCINNTTLESAGLFGVTSGATIENLGMKDVSIYGQYNCGGLAGDTRASMISNCFSGGSISTPLTEYNFQIGGLIGVNEASTISNCYSSCSVSSYCIFGGFVGYNDGIGIITNCYFSGTISPASGYLIGGFVGYDAGAGSFTKNFWNTETSGTSDGAGWQDPDPDDITGKTTAEMKTQSTFTGAGWDFTTVWQIIGTNYPDLRSNSNPALPVVLSSFTAAAAGTSAALSWNTASEVNCAGFEVERRAVNSKQSAASSEQWVKVGYVQGNGTSNSVKVYSYTDSKLNAGKYEYRLKQIDVDGTFKYSQSVEITIAAPKEFALAQNYPNPFNPSTVISYSLPVNGSVSLKVYDIVGREVATLVNEAKEAGSYEAKFDASKLASGMYFYKLTAGNYSSVKKLMLLK